MLNSIGFTGTQYGMTRSQLESLSLLLRALRYGDYQTFHHGDCIGADAEAHDLALPMGFSVVIHPPVDPSKRAFCQGATRELKPKPYLERNLRIVLSSEMLIATPYGSIEEVRSGTWATVRYARRNGLRIRLIMPDGIVRKEGGENG